jgi:hypothetical protein
MKSNLFPRSVKLQYEQMLHRYQNEKNTLDTVDEEDSTDDESLGDNLDSEDALLLKTLTTLPSTATLSDDYIFDRGVNYDWSKRHTVSYAIMKIYNCIVYTIFYHHNLTIHT